MRLALIGLAIGGAGALAAARALQGLLFGVTPADPLTFAAVALGWWRWRWWPATFPPGAPPV